MTPTNPATQAGPLDIGSQPERMRALAHPVRLQLLDVLEREGTATATRCAQLTGETVANCSFHLRTLAKYGFIEPVPRSGRERPWRRIATTWRADYDPAAPHTLMALDELARAVVEQELARVRRMLDAMGDEHGDWVAASMVAKSAFWATREELAELSAQVARLTERFSGRDANPAARPAGARRARLFAVVNADPVPDDAALEGVTRRDAGA